MLMNDPIADMLTRVRNALTARHDSVTLPASNMKKAIAKIKPTAVCSAIKLIAMPAIFLPLAILLGFRGNALVALTIMLGSPTTPSCYIMAKNMKNDGVLTSSVIAATTLLSSVTLTFWIFLMKFLGYIT